MNQNRGTWIGIVVVIIIVALLAWWIIDESSGSSAPIGAATTTAQIASSTAPGSNGEYATTEESSTDVASIVENLSGASQFASLFVSTGVAATIGSAPTSQYTIFVPTDGAMSQLPAGTISNMTAAQLKRFVEYHIVSGRAIDASAMTAGSITALSGDALNFSYGADNIPMVDSALIVAEYEGDNGVVYLIDNAMMPPAAVTQ